MLASRSAVIHLRPLVAMRRGCCGDAMRHACYAFDTIMLLGTYVRTYVIYLIYMIERAMLVTCHIVIVTYTVHMPKNAKHIVTYTLHD